METFLRAWRSAPAMAPAALILCGAAAGREFSVGVLPLVALAMLALASGSSRTRLAFWFAAGALAALLRGERPSSQAARFDDRRPVEAVARVIQHPQRGAFGWSAGARLEVLRQGREVDPRSRELALELPLDRPAQVGERLRLRGYLARSAGYANREPVEPGPLRLRVKTARLVESESAGGAVDRLSQSLRRRVERSLEAARPSAGIAFTRAWILGDLSELQPAWRRAMRRAGLSHLLAVSGFNVSLAAAFCWLLGGWLPGRWRYLPPLGAVILYLLLVGPLAPMLRAALMAALALGALWLRRPPHAANALAVALGGLVLARPGLVSDVAFQLTASATAGLVFLAPALERAWRPLPVWLRTPLAASAAAQIATLPFAFAAFHQTAPVGVIANLWAVPWSALSLLVALAWCALAALSPSWAAIGAPLLDGLAWPFTALSSTPAGLWQVQAATGGVGLGLLVALALAAACLRPRTVGWLVLAAAFGLRCGPGAPAQPRMVVLDVGQGDAILLQDPGHAILIDGGGWSQGDFGGRVLLPALAAEGVHRLDAMVLTHPDRDHCGGLLDLVDYLVVDELWVAPAQQDGCGRDLLLRPGPAVRVLWRGAQHRLGKWRLRALGPEAGGGGTDNGRSLVLLAEANGMRALLTGDIEAASERRLLSGDEALAAEVLKVAHHGSQTSTGGAFLSRVAPRMAVISVGAGNPFGHPHAAVLARLRAARVPVLRTDLAGEIAIVFGDSRRLRIEIPATPR